MKLTKWDKRFLALASHVAMFSKDPSTKCGAVITKGNRIISMGFNGFPSGVEDRPEWYNERDLKYQMIIHAEINAILFAQQSLKLCTIYTQPFPPCCRCTAHIIQSGITKVVAPRPNQELTRRWGNELEIASKMYKSAHVKLVVI